KQPPVPLTPQQCASFAEDFADFGKSKAAPEGYLNAGVLQETCIGDPKKAEEMYRAALAVNKDYAAAHVNLGELFYKAGQTTSAQMEFDNAMKADPKNVQA